MLRAEGRHVEHGALPLAAEPGEATQLAPKESTDRTAQGLQVRRERHLSHSSTRRRLGRREIAVPGHAEQVPNDPDRHLLVDDYATYVAKVHRPIQPRFGVSASTEPP